jgi:hypothetical protein
MRRCALFVTLIAAVAAPAWPCHEAGNVIQNCGFDTDLSSWTVVVGNCSPNSLGSSSAGSISCSSVSNGAQQNISFRQCTDNATAGQTYGFGGDARVESEPGVTCSISVSTFDTDGCTVTQINSDSSNWTPGDGSFQQTSLNDFATGAGATSLNMLINCNAGNTDPFTVVLDDFFAGFELTPVELHQYSVD